MTGRNSNVLCRLVAERPKRKAGTSRMSREAHVRICGGLEVRFLRSTRRRFDDKGETQVRGPHEGESTDAGHRGGITRSSDEVS